MVVHAVAEAVDEAARAGGKSRMASVAPLSPVQAQVIAILQASPGSTIQDVARLIGFTHPTSAYHLTALCRLGLVRRTRDGRMMRHYVQAEPNRSEAYLGALERDERRRRIIQFLRTEPIEQMTINQMRHRLGLPFGLIKRTLVQLEREGLVRLHNQRNVYVITLAGVLAKPANPNASGHHAALGKQDAPGPPHAHGLV